MTTKSEVLSKLEAAFPAVPIDLEGALTGGLDGGAFRQRVEGTTWRAVDRAYVSKRSDVLSYLEPKHLVAVLPIYLQILVEDGTRTPVPDTLLLVLDRKHEKRFDRIVQALTEAQRAAVRAALEVFAGSETGQPADAARDAMQSWA